jgi:hypothetical protein
LAAWISVTAQMGLSYPGSVDSTKLTAVGTVVRFRNETLGEGEFIYLAGAASTVAGSVVSYEIDYNASVATSATALWAGTTNTPLPLAVATAATVASTWGWYQLSGSAVVNCSGTVADGDNLYWQAAGVVSATAIAGKQMVNARAASANDSPASGQCVVTIDRPASQAGVPNSQAAATVGPRNYGVDAGSTDAYAIALSPVLAAYAAGLEIIFLANTANTGAATLNVNGLGAKAIVKGVSTALSDNDILASMLCLVVYDGTSFVLMNPRAL